jgi:hypothetical protein
VDKWFTNRGQVIQITLAAVAVVVAAIVSWPILNDRADWVSYLPIVISLGVLYSVYQVGKIVGAFAANTKRVDNYTSSFQHWSPTIRIGNYWEQSLGLSKIRITLVRIIPEEPPVAELKFDGNVYHSFRPRPEGANNFNSFRLIAFGRRSIDIEKEAVFCFDFNDRQADLVAVRVHHINPHDNEVMLWVVRFSAYSRNAEI